MQTASANSKTFPNLILDAARMLLPHLAAGERIDRRTITAVMTDVFGSSSAEGRWSQRDGFVASEICLLLHARGT